MNKKIVLSGLILGVIGIVLGAFAAHGLKKHLDVAAIKSFETGVRYQMYHAFLLIIIGASNFLNSKAKKTVYIFILVGIFFFSGSIYLLSTNPLTTLDFSSIALVTPIGGLILIITWIILIINVVREKSL